MLMLRFFFLFIVYAFSLFESVYSSILKFRLSVFTLYAISSVEDPGSVLEVCDPELVLNDTRRDETRLELISRIGGTETRLIFSGLVARENSGKIRGKNGKRRDYSIPFGKFPYR